MRLKKNDGPVKLGCLGKVKVGEKHVKGYPVSLDYFRFDSPLKERMERVEKLLGDKPKSINITFYSNDMNEVCSQRLELRDKGGRLIAYGDGETFFVSKEKGWEKIETEGNEENKAFIKSLQTTYSTDKYKCIWRETLILRFLLIGFPEIGYWEVRTYGKETAIPNIISVFDYCLNAFGRVQMIPFTLTIGKHKSNRAGVNREYSVIQLFCNVGIDAVEAVEGWTGKGLFSGDKGKILVKEIEGGGEKIEAIVKGEDKDRIEWEEVVDTEGEAASELELWLKEIEEGLSLCGGDIDNVKKYYNQLCKEHGEANIRSIEGLIDLFISAGMRFEVDN